jgi:hypothetical protein
VFTARYALSPYIKQIRFVFKGLTQGYPAGVGIILHCYKFRWNFNSEKILQISSQPCFHRQPFHWPASRLHFLTAVKEITVTLNIRCKFLKVSAEERAVTIYRQLIGKGRGCNTEKTTLHLSTPSQRHIFRAKIVTWIIYPCRKYYFMCRNRKAVQT